MPEPKKAKVASPKSPSKPKVARAKSAAKVKTGFTAKPKAKIVKPAAKPAAKAPEVKAPVARKTRAYTRRAKGSFAELLKKQGELEAIKKGAKADLKKQYDSLVKEADSIKAQYKGLFNESIESAPKVRDARAKKATGKVVGLRPFSLSEIKEFVKQKKQGRAVKISGRRPKSIARMEDAYRHSEDAKDILKMLNQ